MRVNDDYVKVNVPAQIFSTGQEPPFWQYWQLALQNRKTHEDVFVYGDYQNVDLENEEVYAYFRVGAQPNAKWLVAMN